MLPFNDCKNVKRMCPNEVSVVNMGRPFTVEHGVFCPNSKQRQAYGRQGVAPARDPQYFQRIDTALSQIAAAYASDPGASIDGVYMNATEGIAAAANLPNIRLLVVGNRHDCKEPIDVSSVTSLRVFSQVDCGNPQSLGLLPVHQ